jgi:hypothetical protein
MRFKDVGILDTSKERVGAPQGAGEREFCIACVGSTELNKGGSGGDRSRAVPGGLISISFYLFYIYYIIRTIGTTSAHAACGVPALINSAFLPEHDSAPASFWRMLCAPASFWCILCAPTLLERVMLIPDPLLVHPTPVRPPLPDDIQPTGKQMRPTAPPLPVVRSLARYIVRELRGGYRYYEYDALYSHVRLSLESRGYSEHNAYALLTLAMKFAKAIRPSAGEVVPTALLARLPAICRHACTMPTYAPNRPPALCDCPAVLARKNALPKLTARPPTYPPT